MATPAKARTAERDSSTAKGQTSGSRAPVDAIALLKADHRQVAEWFEEFETADSDDMKASLAEKICAALTVHTTIEEELFYPAFLQATDDTDMHHEAEIEHASAKKLIAELEASDPEDEYFGPKMKVLSEMIKHHVKEEEQPDGMFAEAKESDMDLMELGAQMQARKEELESDDADSE